MELEIEVENENEVVAILLEKEESVVRNVDSQLREFVQKLYKELRDTSPVDSGTYKGNWTTKLTDLGAAIMNDTEYAKYLVNPNRKMVGVSSADLPGRGILHNVEGIVFSKKEEFNEMIEDGVKKGLR